MTMKALVFHGPNDIRIEQVPKPVAGPGEAIIKVTLTTICGTDIHILSGGYPVKPGLIIGHEFVGVVDSLGAGVTGINPGDRVAIGAITPCGQCFYCLSGATSQCGGLLGGWKFGNTINGAQAEYIKVPSAQYNMAKIPDDLTDEQVLFVGDIMTTGFSASDSAKVKIGDSVAIFAQGPVGLCATVGARLSGATKVITVENIPERMEMSKRMGADIVLDFTKVDVISEIKKHTGGYGVDVAIEAIGTQKTFENCIRSVRPGGVVSSLGVYEANVTIPLDAFGAGIGDISIMSTLCPGGFERLRRMISVIQSGRADLTPLITHTFSLDDIKEGYRIFGNKLDKVLKVAIRP
ncbi:MAG TPA: alcohol dehydrogenase catalytic domain-containing protein [Desulfitobacteriaceae bacterium]|nr:alcohol dehydrogenase catalytic domain-containing protein [Desulfitobacteriaceae bacterium]